MKFIAEAEQVAYVGEEGLIQYLAVDSLGAAIPIPGSLPLSCNINGYLMFTN